MVYHFLQETFQIKIYSDLVDKYRVINLLFDLHILQLNNHSFCPMSLTHLVKDNAQYMQGRSSNPKHPTYSFLR